MDSEEHDRLLELATQLSLSHQQMRRDLVGLRRESGLTQRQVAERMGGSQPTVAEFERYDSNPTLSTVERYALAVHATLHIQVKPDSRLEVGAVSR